MTDSVELLSPQPGNATRYSVTMAHPFIVKSLSAETRKAYAAAIRDFFRFVGHAPPLAVTPEHVIAYRDRLITLQRRPRTVVARLAVVRSFFSYLVEAGQLPRTPASAKLGPPPKVPASAAGRALSKKEVLNILTAPDRRKPEGARDHALMLLMARLSKKEVLNILTAPDRRKPEGARDHALMLLM